MDAVAPIRVASSPASLFAIKTRHFLSLSRTQLSYTTTSTNNFKVESKRTSRDDVAFDAAAYEAERHRLDADARKSMEEASEKEIADEDDSKAWKWVIRKRVWDLMEALNIAQFPRPVHHRIPNFVGAPAAATKLSELDAFKEARCVKVNPDSPQKQVRFLTLNGKHMHNLRDCVATDSHTTLYGGGFFKADRDRPSHK